MNLIKTVDCFYLRPSRTIEIILISNSFKQKVLYMYNYEGYFFRVFENILDLINCLADNFVPHHHFDNEEQLDNYLEKYLLE